MAKKDIQQSAMSKFIVILRIVLIVGFVLCSLLLFMPDKDMETSFTMGTDVTNSTVYQYTLQAVSTIAKDDEIEEINKIRYIIMDDVEDQEKRIAVKVTYRNESEEKTRCFISRYVTESLSVGYREHRVWKQTEVSQREYFIVKRLTVIEQIIPIFGTDAREYELDTNAISVIFAQGGR